MLSRVETENALEVQKRCFKLLQWLDNAIRDGLVSAATVPAHERADTAQAIQGWIQHHLHLLPAECRPAPEELESFSRFFGTFLETSFDFVEHPSDRYVSECGCGCAWCARLADPQYLKPKTVTRAHKDRASRLRLRRLEMLARGEGLPSFEPRLLEALHDETVKHDASLSAYGAALLDRVNGISDGPAVLALWRSFAWTRNGSPIHNFKLKAQDILQAEQNLIRMLREHASTTAALSA